jgi:hypothetical protein
MIADLVNWTLAATTANTGTVDHVALLCLVSQAAGLVRAGGPGQANNSWHLAVLPAADAEQEANDIALLLLVELLQILQGNKNMV